MQLIPPNYFAKQILTVYIFVLWYSVEDSQTFNSLKNYSTPKFRLHYNQIKSMDVTNPYLLSQSFLNYKNNVNFYPMMSELD